jgi:hypothetical protein
MSNVTWWTPENPTFQKASENIVYIIRALEARIVNLETEIHGGEVPTFTASGAFTAKIYGPRWTCEHGYEITDVRITAGTPPVSTLTCNLLVNGAIWATLSIAAGGRTTHVAGGDMTNVNLETDDYLQLQVVSTGSAQDLVLSVRLMRTE